MRHHGGIHGCFVATLLAMTMMELRLRRREENTSRKSGVVELVEIAHRLHDRLEIRARIERVEQLRGVGQQSCERWIAIRTSSCGVSDSLPCPDNRILEFSPFSRSSDWM